MGENEKGTDIYYFPDDHKYDGYAVEFRRNDFKGSMMEEILYTVFKRNQQTKQIQDQNDNITNNEFNQTGSQNIHKFKHQHLLHFDSIPLVLFVCVFVVCFQFIFY